MEVTIRNIGNSKGVVLPKPLLAQVGLDGEASASIVVENDAIVIRKPDKLVRTGWAEAAAKVAAQENDTLLMGELANVSDSELSW